MHLTASGLRPSAVRCIRPPEAFGCQHSSLATSEWLLYHEKIHFAFRFLGKVPLTCDNNGSLKICLFMVAMTTCEVNK